MNGRGAQTPIEQLIFLTIRPKDPTIDPADRPAKLYARFLETTGWSHPGGLVMRRFENGSPFEREELYMTPPEGRVFAARCARPIQPPDGLPNTCISEIRIEGLDVQMRFSPDMLVNWETLVLGSRQLVSSFLR